MNKYNFMVEQDGKKIFLYSEKEEEIIIPGIRKQSSPIKQKKSLLFLVIFLIILMLFLGFLFAKNINKVKIKKHKNILDDNLDYSLSSGIEMTKK